MNESPAYTSGSGIFEPKICQFDSAKCVLCAPAECTIANTTARRLLDRASSESESFLELDQLTIFYLMEWFG